MTRRATIDFGIDLGTTNSTVAVINGAATDVIQNSRGSVLTPSAVYLDKRGQVFVGEGAKERVESDPDDAVGEFKLRMGMGAEGAMLFTRSGRTMLPEELSAEVLKALRNDVREKRGEDLSSAVITVPAAFDLPECSATQRAAQLAGLTTAPLLQEPVAAALAYGFQSSAHNVYWLVYDFGGGTFDAAVIQLRDGIIHVVNHAGDNMLGGKNIDWALVNTLFVPSLLSRHTLTDFRRDRTVTRWRGAFAKLKAAAEAAKIRVSRTQQPFVVTCDGLCQDDRGELVDFEFTLTPESLDEVAEPFVLRSIELCQRALREKQMPTAAIERVILVGGTGLLPLARRNIEESIKSTIDLTVNPLEAVARGAAIFASSQRLQSTGVHNSSARPGAIRLELDYDPVGSAQDFPVSGRLVQAQGRPLTGYTLQISDAAGRWRSGRIPLESNGAFLTEAHAERGEACEFVLEVFDAVGTRQVVEPATFTYTVGMVIAGAPLTHNVGVETAGNGVDWFFKKGATLPARKRRVHRAAMLLKKGAPGQSLRVPVVEGENSRLADRNKLIGYVEIPSTLESLRRDVPIGAEIEITLELDESRNLKVFVEIPISDTTIDTNLNMQGYQARPASELRHDLDRETVRLNELVTQSSLPAGSAVLPTDDWIKAKSLLNEVKELVSAAKGDVDAAKEAEKRLRELKGQLDEGEYSFEWPKAQQEAHEALDDAKQLVDETGGPREKRLLPEVEQEVQRALDAHDLHLLKSASDHLRDLSFRIQEGRIEFWIEWLEYLKKRRESMRDTSMAERLFSQASKCVDSGDITGLRAATRQLYGLLPDAEQGKARSRGFGGGTISGG